ncbi:MAG: MFS transporter, partial [Halobacteriales archaeon]|nr:MFS transporter [Halobacteriales archaeon]
MDTDAHTGALALLVGTIHFSFHLFVRLVPPLIPVLAIALSLPLWKLGLLVSVYFVGSSVGLLPMGVLSDSYDRRLTLSAALAVVGIGYLLFGLS